VQSRAHALARTDALADMGESLHGDHAGVARQGLRHDRSTDLVVDVRHVPAFAPGGLPQPLLGGGGAVASKKPTTQRQQSVTVVAELSAAEYRAGAWRPGVMHRVRGLRSSH